MTSEAVLKTSHFPFNISRKLVTRKGILAQTLSLISLFYLLAQTSLFPFACRFQHLAVSPLPGFYLAAPIKTSVFPFNLLKRTLAAPLYRIS